MRESRNPSKHHRTSSASSLSNHGLFLWIPIAGATMVLQNRNVWYLLEPQFTTTRSRMQLHPGTMSAGCITVNDKDCFDKLAVVLNQSGTDTGTGYDGYPPGNAEGVTNSASSVTCVAWLDVTSGACGGP